MSVFSILASFAARRKKRQQSLAERLQAAPLSPRALERRRVLDASAAAALLTPLGDAGSTVQTADFSAESGPVEFDEEVIALPGISENTGPSNLVISPFDPILENGVAQLELTFDNPTIPPTNEEDGRCSHD